MERPRTLALAALAIPFVCGAFHRGPSDEATDEAQGKQWWAHVQVLAADDMQGRLTGSPEYLRAAAYVVDKFKADGLSPAGVDGFYQPVQFYVSRIDAAQSSLELTSGCPTCRFYNHAPLVLGKDAILSARANPPSTTDAPLVFIGYGLHLPESGYDDFNSAELPLASLKGKIVVEINGGPADLPGALKSYARTAPHAKALSDAGALGVISIPTPKSMDFGWDRVASLASQPAMTLAASPTDAGVAAMHPALADDHHPRLGVTFNPAQAEKLFAGTGHTFAEMLALADAQKPLPHFDLHKSLHATVAVMHSTVSSPNIAAKLEGSDPKLKSEYVIVSAHLDHLGVGEPVKTPPADPHKTIYNGAMDDASGVATVLETAKALSERAAHGDRPKRSILFLIFTAEEKGLLGSRYFAGHPTVPAGSIKADLNLDMFMPLFALKKLHVQGLEQSTLGDDARLVGKQHGIVIAGDPEPDRNSFIRTDQYSFVQAGVPALAMKFGWEMGSPEYKAWRAWLAGRYHSTADDLNQPVDLVAAAQFNRFYEDLALEVANNPGTPHYLSSSFFHRFETQ
jgi:Zn-dependent M28 family amino/carboxypeptidase